MVEMNEFQTQSDSATITEYYKLGNLYTVEIFYLVLGTGKFKIKMMTDVASS